MKKVTPFLVLVFFFMNTANLFAQVRYLNESFNKIESDADFPPYGWLNVDADGDGFTWRSSSVGDGYNETIGAISDSWQMVDLKPKNWLITPQLLVENANDSIKFLLASFTDPYNNNEVNPESYSLYISTKTSKIEDFTDLIDDMTFTKDQDGWQTKAFSLAKYAGQKIYIGFLHNTTSSALVLRLDNVVGPRIIDYETDLSILSHINPPSDGCDVDNMPVSVVLQNLGVNPMSNFPIHTQIAIGDDNDTWTLGACIDDTVRREIAAGDTIHFTFSTPSAYGEYFCSILTRTWISLPADEYHRNDTAFTLSTTQTAVGLPLTTTVETTEEMKNWAIVKAYPPDVFNFGWTLGSNPDLARSGANYLVFACEYNEGAHYDGTKDYFATPCVYLEKGIKYKVNFYYKFRINDTCSFRLMLGKEQHELLENHTVITDRMVTKDREGYTLFSSPSFEVEESGSYYIGTMAHHTPVASERDYWMIFLEDWTLSTESALATVDLGIETIEVPFDCNLSAEEEVKITYSNQSGLAAANFEIAYQIKGKPIVIETVTDTIYPEEQASYTFKAKADLSTYGEYEILGWVNSTEDGNEENNQKTVFAENKEQKSTPFVDDFESYASLESFESTWEIINQFEKGGFVLSDDYTDDGEFSYSGVSFLAHAQSDNPNNVSDWAISPCIELEKDTLYTVSFFCRVFEPSTVKNNLKISLLSAYDTTAFMQEIAQKENIKEKVYSLVRGSVKVDRTQTYHIAFNLENGAKGADIFIENVSIENANTVGNDEIGQNLISVYPNPAKENLYILSNTQIKSVELLNLLGTSVYKQEGLTAENGFSIPLEQIRSGMYILQVETSKGREIKKIMVK